MKLKYNRDNELEIVGLGVFEPGQFIITDDEARAKKYLDTGYFDLVKEKKRKVKKNLKRKELKNNGTRRKRTHRN